MTGLVRNESDADLSISSRGRSSGRRKNSNCDSRNDAFAYEGRNFGEGWEDSRRSRRHLGTVATHEPSTKSGAFDQVRLWDAISKRHLCEGTDIESEALDILLIKV